MSEEQDITSYTDPSPTSHPPKRLVVEVGSVRAASFTFYDRIQIGRYREGREAPGVLLVKDPTVSSAHCVITQDPDGRCFIRDTSRNGTRVGGRRLSPSVKTELMIGEVLSVGKVLALRLDGDRPNLGAMEDEIPMQTVEDSNTVVVTVLVGDIRNYTNMVREADSAELQDAVTRVFSRLEQSVGQLGGTVKEFQGDALVAFWERGARKDHAADACRAALGLQYLVEELAENRSVWNVQGYPLHMDWALATGPVKITGYGQHNAMGLSMVGEPVVLAFRIEKLADDSTGSIVVCPATQMMASGSFRFRDLGKVHPKGFDKPLSLYSLVEAKG
jgi:class 3 adenylate cyclase